jgi:hypothetical protein
LVDEADILKPDVVLLQLFPANDFNDLYKDDLFEFSKEGKLVYQPKNLVERSLPVCRLCVVIRKALTGHYFDPAAEKDLAVKLFRDTYDWDLLRDPESAESRKKIALMRAILGNITHFLAARKIEFGIILIPSLDNLQDPGDFHKHGITPERYYFAEGLTAQICKDEKIRCLNLTSQFLAFHGGKLFDERDGHLTAEGDQYATGIIKQSFADFWP